MPGVTGSGSGHTIGVETGHTGVTVMETGHTCVFPHEYIVDGSSSLSESVSSSFKDTPLHDSVFKTESCSGHNRLNDMIRERGAGRRKGEWDGW